MAKSTGADEKKTIRVEIQPLSLARKDDVKRIQGLFLSTYFDLVPAGVRVRLTASPLILTIWLTLFALAFKTIPDYCSRLGWPQQLMLSVQIIIGIVSLCGGLIALLWYVDKCDISERVIIGLENDLRDPYAYYTEGKFWILLVNDTVAGCIGVDTKAGPLIDARTRTRDGSVRDFARTADAPEIAAATWPGVARILARLDDAVRLVVQSTQAQVHTFLVRLHLVSPAATTARVVFKPQEKNEASLRRLAIRTEYQGHGLSTLLINCAIAWAKKHGVERVVAETNEIQTKAASILQKQHGFTLISRESQSRYHTSSTWKLEMNAWSQKESPFQAVPEEKVD